MEATDPIARALAQPHIVQAICSHLPMESLASAALVNRDFFTFATQERWFAGSLWTLAQRIQLSRRQLYASKVRLLVMNRARIAKYRQAFRRIQFSGLKFLSLVRYSTPLEEGEEAAAYYRELHCYLSPQLSHLILQKCRLTNTFLQQVESRCQNLRFLRLDSNWAHYTDEALAALIAASPLLEDLRFEPRDPVPGGFGVLGEDALDFPKDCVIDATLLQCARQRKLLSLQLGTFVNLTPQLFERIRDQVPEPFPILGRFSGAVPSMAAPLLGQWCKHMHQLYLSVYDTEAPVLQGISKMKNLKVMQIHFVPGTTFCSPDIMSLQALSKLEICSFFSFVRPYPLLSLACDDFQKWIASFPDLKVLELEVDKLNLRDNRTGGCLATLSRCCPRIERLVWPGTIHFCELNLEQSTTPLFPNLRQLQVEYATVSDDEQSFPNNCSQEELTRIMRHHFPKLFRFTTEYPDDSSGAELIRETIRRYARKSTSVSSTNSNQYEGYERYYS